jgi:hypothetical protein
MILLREEMNGMRGGQALMGIYQVLNSARPGVLFMMVTKD